jgi:hypothetical protein
VCICLILYIFCGHGQLLYLFVYVALFTADDTFMLNDELVMDLEYVTIYDDKFPGFFFILFEDG